MYKRSVSRSLTYIVLVIVAFLFIFPFLWMLFTSLKTTEQVFEWPPRLLPKPITFGAYDEVWTLWPFPRYYLNSIIISIAVTAVSLFFCSLAGFAFAHYQFRGKQSWFIYLLISMMFPFQVRMIPTYIIIKNLAWLNTYQGLIIPWWATAFAIFLMRQMMVPIPRDLFDSARIDGCSEFRIFLRIALPLCIPGLVALGIWNFMQSWNDFIWPLIIVTREEMKTLPLALAGMTGEGTEVIMTWPQRMAGTTLVVLPVLILFLFFQRQFIRGLALQAGLKY
jgi:multiple sugar transport system permease protein